MCHLGFDQKWILSILPLPRTDTLPATKYEPNLAICGQVIDVIDDSIIFPAHFGGGVIFYCFILKSAVD